MKQIVPDSTSDGSCSNLARLSPIESIKNDQILKERLVNWENKGEQNRLHIDHSEINYCCYNASYERSRYTIAFKDETSLSNVCVIIYYDFILQRGNITL